MLYFSNPKVVNGGFTRASRRSLSLHPKRLPAAMGLSAGLGVSSAPDTEVAVKKAVTAARAKLPEGSPPTIAFVNATVDRDMGKFSECLAEQLGGVPLHGHTSCASVLDGATIVPNGVGVLLLNTEEGALVSAAQPLTDSVSPYQAGRKAAQALVEQMDSAADVKHVLFTATPGIEDEGMKGVESVLGSTPLFGGSAADNTIEGNWNLVTSSAGVFPSGVSLVGVTGRVSFGASLVSPYTPSDRSAKITGAEGRRILTLDDRPAAEVLNEWMGGQIETQYKEGGSIGVECSTFPLAIQKENGSYASLHAAGVNAQKGSIDCFAQAEVGQTLTVMNKDGGKDSVLAASLGLERAYDAAKQKGEITEPAAGLFIYCGGLSFAVGDRFEESLAPLKDKVPMIGSTVFGEQGNFDGSNLHCNLAVGVALFE